MSPAVGTSLIGIRTFTASGTYTPSPGMAYAIVECVGSGGGGGGVVGAAGMSISGGGGGSGGYSRKLVTAAQVGASQAVTIPAGGSGGAAGANNGGNGGAASFGSLCIANGGFGGAYAQSGAQVGLGSQGALLGTGDVTATGAPGLAGAYNTSGDVTIVSSSGTGGSSIYGAGGAAHYQLDGNPATGFGGGGAGGSAYNEVTSRPGGQGGSGLCIVTEFAGGGIANDPTKVLKSGDTMTGSLDANSSAVFENIRLGGNDKPGIRFIKSGAGETEDGRIWRQANSVKIGGDTGVQYTFGLGPSGVFQADAYLVVARADPAVFLNKTASGTSSYLIGQTNGLHRWTIELGDGAAETGGNNGSNFTIYRWSDASTGIDAPLTISRATGQVTVGRELSVGSSAFFAGGVICTTVLDGYVGAGFVRKSGTGTSFGGYYANSGGAYIGSIAITETGTAFNTTSDVRLKDALTPFSRGREMIDQLPVYEFTWKSTMEPGIGLVAQEVNEVYPQAVTPGEELLRGNQEFAPWSIDYSKYVPVLIQALQEAHKRIDVLEQQLKRKK